MPKVSPALRIAIYSAIVVERDAISRSFLNKFEILQDIHNSGFPVEVVGFTHYTDYRAPNLLTIDDLPQLLRHPEHRAADLHIFEYGMSYDLFNSIFLHSGRSLAIDHNTTPPELISDPHTREICSRSRHERHNLHHVTHVACDSEFTLRELTDMGLDPQRLSVLHLPPTHGIQAPPVTPPHPRSTVDLLYIGRLAEAKGVLDLLAAFTLLRSRGIAGYSLTVAGSSRFSDASVMDGLLQTAKDYPDIFRLILDADDGQIDSLLAAADALIIPSHHEGYCVPVVEALSAQCFVIGSNAGNIPNIMGGLGLLFPPGDVHALAAYITDFIVRMRAASLSGEPLLLRTSTGEYSHDAWLLRVDRHLENYNHERYLRDFLDILRHLVGPHLTWATDYLAQLLGLAPDSLETVPA